MQKHYPMILAFLLLIAAQNAWGTKISNIRISDSTSSSIVLSWVTDVPAGATANYGLTTALGSSATDPRPDDDTHRVQITGLSPDSAYFYEVVSGGTTDNNSGSFYTFRTAKVSAAGTPYNLYGKVLLSDGSTSAQGALVYLTVTNNGVTSVPLSDITDANGNWDVNLGNLKSSTTNSTLAYAVGDAISLSVQAGNDGNASGEYAIDGISPQELSPEAVLGAPDIRVEPTSLSFTKTVGINSSKSMRSLNVSRINFNQGAPAVQGEMLVKFSTRTFQGNHVQVNGIIQTSQVSVNAVLTRLQAQTMVRALPTTRSPLGDIYRVRFAAPVSLNDALQQMAVDPNVEWVEPNYLAFTSVTPNDPAFAQQWGLAKIQVDRAWDVSQGNPDTVIAVVDTGVDYDHVDLAANIWHNPGETPGNGVDDDGNGYVDDDIGWDFVDVTVEAAPGEDMGPRDRDPMDRQGHGTHCAGIVAATTGNGVGMAGVAWNSRIMALRAGYKTKDGGGSLATTDWAAALHYAADNGADVISMSFGSDASSSTGRAAIEYALSKGCVLVAAAGNDGVSTLHYPAAYDGVIAVAASDVDDNRASFSNYGPWVDIAAPGVSIYSSLPGNAYESWNGTSMAAPLVAGVAGLILSQNPMLTTDAVGYQLIDSADDIGWIRRVNAYRAVTSGSNVLMVYNDGTAPLQVTGITAQNASPWVATDTTTFSVPAGGTQAVVVSLNTTGLNVGMHTERLLVYSNDPDEDPYPDGVDVTLEITNNAPQISSLTADPNPVDDDSTSMVTTVATDADGHELIYAWDTTGGSITGSGNMVTYHPPGVDVQTTYTINLTVSDGYGGNDDDSVNVIVNPSTSSITLTSPNGGETWKGGSSQAITWNTTGRNIDHVRLLYSTDSGGGYQDIIASTPNDGNHTWTVPTLDLATNRVKAIAEDDNNAQLAEDASDADFAIDSTAPETTISLAGTQGENNWYTSDVIVTLSATDNLSGVEGTRYKINTGDWQTYALPFIVSGSTVAYQSEDQSGNIEAEGSQQVQIDKTPPTTPVVTDDGASTSSTSELHASWTATDDGSGVTAYQYAVGTGPGNTDVVDWTPVGGDTEVRATGLSLTEKQVYYFAVRAKNEAGQWSEIGASDGILAGVAGVIQTHALVRGWHLLSCPGEAAVPNIAQLVQGTSVSPTSYTWNTGVRRYDTATSLEFGTAYWFAAMEDTQLVVQYQPRNSLTRDVQRGWNMIGGVSVETPVISLSSDPASALLPLVYRWDAVLQKYERVTTIEPGGGYWIPFIKDAVLSMNVIVAPAMEAQPAAQRLTPIWESVLEIQTSHDRQVLTFGMHSTASAGLDGVWDSPLPPIPAGVPKGLKGGWSVEDPEFSLLDRSIVKDATHVSLPLLLETDESAELHWRHLPATHRCVLWYQKQPIQMTQVSSVQLSPGEHLLTLVLDLLDALPKQTQLLANYPNPFNPETWIPYRLAADSDVTLVVHSMAGHEVRRFHLGPQLAGEYRDREHAVYWDGKNQFGEVVSSGVYFYTLQTDDGIQTRKLTVVR